MAEGFPDCAKGSASLFENTDCCDFNNQRKRLSDDQTIVEDVNAFIDAEFGKIYEEEEEQESPADGRLYETEAKPSPLAEQVESLSVIYSSSRVDDVFAVGYCDGEGGRRKEEIKTSSNRELICVKCRARQTSACFDREDNGGTLLTQHRDLQASRNVRMEDQVTEEQLSDISDEVGACYRRLAPKLDIKDCKIQNIEDENRRNADRAHAILMEWKKRKGSEATVQALAKILTGLDMKHITDMLLPDLPPASMPSDELTMELKIKCQLSNKALLCEDSNGKRYKVTEFTGTDSNEHEISYSESTSKRTLSPIDGKKSPDLRRLESFKRIREELDRLQERLKKHRVDDTDVQSVPNHVGHGQGCEQKLQQCNLKEVDELLKSCEFQCQSWQGMYNGLVKLIGEVGSLDENGQAVQQLSDFAKAMQQQEKRFFPKITELEEQHEKMNEEQLTRLDELRRWRKTQSQQLEGIEKLLASLLERPKSKVMNRRSEPNLSFFPKVSGRRRSKTDSGGRKLTSSTSLHDVKENMDLKISGPLNPRKMYCFMETDPTH